MKNILVVTGHTHEENSVANKEILALLKERYPKAEFDRLELLYGDYKIDVEAEREKLLWADTIVIQSPLFWYSLTSLIMRWFEEVFAYGWAYGADTYAVASKNLVVGLTAACGNDEYAPHGDKGITIDEIFKTCEATCKFCKMNFKGGVFTGNMLYTGEDTQLRVIHKQAKEHCEQLVQYIEA